MLRTIAGISGAGLIVLCGLAVSPPTPPPRPVVQPEVPAAPEPPPTPTVAANVPAPAMPGAQPGMPGQPQGG